MAVFFPLSASGKDSRPLFALRPVGDGHPHPAVPRPLPDRRDRAIVPGPVQVVPDPGGGAFADGLPLGGAECSAGRPGAGGGEMALVEFVASGEGRRDVAERLAGRGATTTSRLSYSTYRIGRLSDVLSEVSTPCLVATGRFRQS